MKKLLFLLLSTTFAFAQIDRVEQLDRLMNGQAKADQHGRQRPGRCASHAVDLVEQANLF